MYITAFGIRFLAIINGPIKQNFESQEGAGSEQFYVNRKLPGDNESLANRGVLEKKLSKRKEEKACQINFNKKYFCNTANAPLPSAQSANLEFVLSNSF